MLNIQSNISLLPYNTFQIDAKAKYFVEISTIEELQELFATEIFKQEKKLILGGGANVLFTGDVEGLVVKVGLRGITPLTKGGGSEATGGSELEGTS